MPMVWYIPPLSPVVDLLRDQGHDAEDAGNLFGAIEALRIPVEYLAELFTAGDTADGHRRAAPAWRRCVPTCATSRSAASGRRVDPAAVGMTGEAMYEMYRLLAIAKYEERYVIPKAHEEQAHELEELGCSLDFDGGPYEHVRVRSVRRGERPARRRWPSRRSMRSKQRQTSESAATGAQSAGPGQPAQLGRHRRAARTVPARQRDVDAGRRARPSDAGPRATGSSTRPRRWCLGYPDDDAARLAADAQPAALAEAAPPPARRLRRRCWTCWATTPAAERAERTTSRSFDLSREHALLPDATGPTATPAGAARRWSTLKQRYRRAGFLVDTHGELPDYLPLVLEYAARRRPGRRARRCCRSTGRSLELLRLALVERQRPPTPASSPRSAPPCPGASPARPAGRAWRWPPPDRRRDRSGLEPYDPRLLPLRQPVGTVR